MSSNRPDHDDDLVGGYDVWPMADATSVRTYTSSSPASAAKLRARDDYEVQESYAGDGDYFVRDRLTDRVYRIAIYYDMRPVFDAGEPHEVPMPPAVHVLWGGNTICEDKRLRGVPKDWPDGQRWISLRDVANGAEVPTDPCAACWAKTPEIITRLRQIGADR